MNTKPHRTNSDFQLKYFIAGSCKTPDAAWAILYEQKNDIETKVKHCEVQRLRTNAKIETAKEILSNNNITNAARMNAEADLLEVEVFQHSWEMNLKAAQNELKTINKLMEELEPLRKYKHLDFFEANEAAQEEEWLLELQERAENFLMTQGTIPHDQLHTMRCHPQFQQKLVPYIVTFQQKMIEANNTGDAAAGMKLLVNNDKLFLT
jgi:hypothetical protein